MSANAPNRAPDPVNADADAPYLMGGVRVVVMLMVLKALYTLFQGGRLLISYARHVQFGAPPSDMWQPTSEWMLGWLLAARSVYWLAAAVVLYYGVRLLVRVALAYLRHHAEPEGKSP